MSRLFIFCLCFFLCSCFGSAQQVERSVSSVELQSGQLYIVPFETIMVPEEVSAELFDFFVDRLSNQGAQQGVEFIILKQGLTQIDADWLAERDYLTGEIFAYIEEIGSTMTDIKARSRIRLYQFGRSEPALQLTFPTESFFQNDYSSLGAERRKLAEKIATSLADQFLAAVSDR